jgi:phototropin
LCGNLFRRESSQTTLPFPEFKMENESSEQPSRPLSPPPSPFSPLSSRRKKIPDPLTRRLKNISGLKSHVNDSALRQYTDYDNIGTPRSPFFSPGIWTGNTFGEPDERTNLEQFEDVFTPQLPILDVFAMKTVNTVLKDQAAVARMRQFAQSRGRYKDIDFLMKVEEYSNTMSMVSSIMANISIKFTGVAASQPIRLPMAVSKSLNTDIKNVSSSLLPGLESLFDDAKSHIERSLAQDVYPDFLKNQLSLSLQTIGPGYSPSQICSGFGDAFCITDTYQPDWPIVFVSDGLAGLTGYNHDELVNRNCRFLQGPGTRASGVDRIRDAVSKNQEWSELLLNYRKDGREFWNLLFTTHLMGLDGHVRYHLGGQVDVSEVLESQESVTSLLGYVPPLRDNSRLPAQHDENETRGSWRNAFSSSHKDRRPPHHHRGDRDAKYPPQTSRNKFFKGFTRRHSRGDTPVSPIDTESTHDLSNSEPSTPLDHRGSLNIPSPSAPTHHAVLSPYSRFMVLEYVPPGSTGSNGGSDKKSVRAQLPVTFCSAAVLDSLSNGGSAVPKCLADVIGYSVFEVLSEAGSSPSINKSFKSTVRANLAEGRSVKLDLTLNGNHGNGLRRPRGLSLSRKSSGVGLSALGLGGGGGGGGELSAPSIHGHTTGRPGALRKSMSLERLAQPSHHGGAEDFVSYWTPLKDGQRVTRFVVVVFIPDVS